MDPKKERYKRIRGALLKSLAHAHPGSIDLVVLQALMDDLRMPMTKEECISHLVYLEEKKYVRVDKRSAGGVELMMVTISADGLDVLDEFKPECGVDTHF